MAELPKTLRPIETLLVPSFPVLGPFMMLFGEMIDKSAFPGSLIALGQFYESAETVLPSCGLIKLVALLWISFLLKSDPIPGSFWCVDGWVYFLFQVVPLMFPVCESMLKKTSVVIGPV